MAIDPKKFDGLNEDRLLKFKERILWHQNNGGFSNDLKPLADHDGMTLLEFPILYVKAHMHTPRQTFEN